MVFVWNLIRGKTLSFLMILQKVADNIWQIGIIHFALSVI